MADFRSASLTGFSRGGAPQQETSHATPSTFPDCTGACGADQLSAPAQQTVTQSYRGVVTLVVGEQPDAVRVGEAVTVSYTVDTTASDVDPSPQAGIFPAGLLSLTVMLPDSDFAASSGVGQIQTFDNTENPDDQISFPHQEHCSALMIFKACRSRLLKLKFIGSTDMFASDAVPTPPARCA